MIIGKEIVRKKKKKDKKKRLSPENVELQVIWNCMGYIICLTSFW